MVVWLSVLTVLLCFLTGKDNIREVIAFPKNNKASDPMTQAPSLVADKQLEELALHVDLRK